MGLFAQFRQEYVLTSEMVHHKGRRVDARVQENEGDVLT